MRAAQEDGQGLARHGGSRRVTLEVANPATGETVARLDSDDAAAIAAKYRRARAAQPRWAALPLEDRLAAVARLRSLAASRAEALARILTTEVGKPIAQSRNELKGLLARIDFFLAEARPVLATQTVHAEADGSLEERISHEPLGVVANVSAWNYPWFVGSNVFIPALLAGNAVLYKPSEFASLTGLEVARLMAESGVPEDVFVPIVGAGEAGAALVAQPVDGIFFTGSAATGERIARAAAGRLVKLQLELGGKDPVYVCDDVEVPRAAASVADGAFYNTGQSCCSVERIYVHERSIASWRRSWPRCAAIASATRWTNRPTSARSRARRSSTCSNRRWPTRSRRARRCSPADGGSRARETGSSPPCSSGSTIRCRSCARRRSVR